MEWSDNFRKINDYVWEVPTAAKKGMRVPARIYASRKLLEGMEEGVFEQITNVATLPEVAEYAFCMPDGHWGYGFPIGGVAAMDADKGVISPGGIGFDINCGMRLVRTDLRHDDIKPHLEKLVNRLFSHVPAGVGKSGLIKLNKKDFGRLIEKGARWCIEQGYGWAEDLERTEESGCIKTADKEFVSDKAIKRGQDQVGTLGSGNHYLEIQVLKNENIHDKKAAEVMGLFGDNQVVIMLHCGSRGFGHQVASDYLKSFLQVMGKKYNLSVPDKQLACCPFKSTEGQAYYSAMNCAINMAFANRQLILHKVREVFSEVLGRSPQELGMHQVYDVTHNTAKVEEHEVGGKKRKLLIHRKGATRAFCAGMNDVPQVYKDVGQPVIIGGSMETGSYLMTGVKGGAQTFFSTAHGSGRTMSRHQAKKQFRGKDLKERLKNKGIYVQAASYSGLAEEAGAAYKDIDAVVETAEKAGISKAVARFIPVGNIKG